MTQMGLDIEAIEHLDFEFAPPCENTEGCDKAATWKLTTACCGGVFLFCDDCKNLEMGMLAAMPNTTFKCAICKNRVALRDHVYSVERL